MQQLAHAAQACSNQAACHASFPCACEGCACEGFAYLGACAGHWRSLVVASGAARGLEGPTDRVWALASDTQHTLGPSDALRQASLLRQDGLSALMGVLALGPLPLLPRRCRAPSVPMSCICADVMHLCRCHASVPLLPRRCRAPSVPIPLYSQPGAAAAAAEDEDIFGDAGTDYKPSVDPSRKKKPPSQVLTRSCVHLLTHMHACKHACQHSHTLIPHISPTLHRPPPHTHCAHTCMFFC